MEVSVESLVTKVQDLIGSFVDLAGWKVLSCPVKSVKFWKWVSNPRQIARAYLLLSPLQNPAIAALMAEEVLTHWPDDKLEPSDFAFSRGGC